MTRPVWSRLALALAATVLLPCSSPATDAVDLSDVVAGRWCGIRVAGQLTYRHSLSITAVGDHFVGVDTISVGLSEARVARVLAGDEAAVAAAGDFSFVVRQTYDIDLRDGTLSMRGTTARELFSGGRRGLQWQLDEFSGPLREPGVFTCLRESGEGGLDSFYLARRGALDRANPISFGRGVVHRITCADDRRFSYTCYLPSSYRPGRPAPVLVYDAPEGMARPLSIAAADELGWVMVGLQQSRNGLRHNLGEHNCAAAVFDLRQRFSLDPKRWYFGGFSGGARRSSWRGMSHADNCAGLLCMGAAFLKYARGDKAGRFIAPPLEQPVALLVGDEDFMYDEVAGEAVAFAEAEGRVHRLWTYEGEHVMPPRALIVEAIRWLDARWSE